MSFDTTITRIFRTLRPVKHDGTTYDAGTRLSLTEDEANHLGPEIVAAHTPAVSELSAAELADAAKEAREREKTAAADAAKPGK